MTDERGGHITWSPDGERLAFVKYTPLLDATPPSVWMYDVGTREETALDILRGHDAYQLSWSPDGRYLVWSERPTNGATDGDAAPQSIVHVFDSTSQTTVSYSHDGIIYSYHWSPDGTGLIWEEGATFYLLDVATGALAYSAPAGAADVGYSWSFDGRSIAYVGLTDDPLLNDVYVMDVDQDEVSELSSKLGLQDVVWLKVDWVGAR